MNARRRLARFLCGLGVLLALLGHGPAAWAQWQDLNGLRVAVDCSWPATVGRGYVPLVVHLDNQREDEAPVELEASMRGWANPEQYVYRDVVLQPGERRDVELIVPMFTSNTGAWGSNYTVRVRSGRRVEHFGTGVGSAGWESQMKVFVLFSGTPWDSKLPDDLQQALKTGDLSGTGTPIPDVAAAVGSFDDMPSDAAAYTSLDAVLVDTRSGFPKAERLAPLLSWVRLGGRAVFLGDEKDVRDELVRLAGMGGAFDRRFALETGVSARQLELAGRGGDNVIADAPRLERAGAEAWRHGFGVLYIAPAFESDADRDVMRSALRPASPHALLGSIVPAPGSAGALVRRPLSIPGVDSLPLRSFMAMLLLFALLIGPANLIFLRRLKRPALLLLTVPGFSLLASVGVVAYGILGQGVDVKTAAYTLTLLDQQNHRAATAEWRQMFAGLSPGRGLVPRAGTTVFPVFAGDRDVRYELETGDERVLSGAFLPVRTPVDHIWLSEEASRLRMEFDIQGDVILVTNSLPVRVEGVLLRRGESSWFARSEWIEPGEQARLSRVGEEVLETFRDAHPQLQDREVAVGGYVALLAQNPFRDDCGVEHNEIAGQHALLGLLAAEEVR